MITDLKWVKNFNDDKFTLWAFDGHVWFIVPFIVEATDE